MVTSPFQQLVIARDFEVRRSELTCPAHSLKMMTRAASSGADEVILDLEDATAVSQKVSARKTLIEALLTLDFGRSLRAFRCNNVRTPFCYRDIVEVVEAAGARIESLVVPKVEGPEDVLFVDTLLGQIEQAHGLPPGRIRIEALIESARGLLRAAEIARCTPRLASLIFGIADYAGDIGAKDFVHDQFLAYHYPKAHIIAAARSAGLMVIDNVTVQFRDLEQVKRDAEAGARMGFDGKWAIHPSHLEPIHAAYTPSRAELERAMAIMRAYAEADTRQGIGAMVFQDEMIDAASLRVEWKKLAVARKAGLVDESFTQLLEPAK
jgi:citrate lyase subunit beta/citryl-CoA lyase